LLWLNKNNGGAVKSLFKRFRFLKMGERKKDHSETAGSRSGVQAAQIRKEAEAEVEALILGTKKFNCNKMTPKPTV